MFVFDNYAEMDHHQLVEITFFCIETLFEFLLMHIHENTKDVTKHMQREMQNVCF